MPVLVGAGVIDVGFEVVVLLKPPRFGVGLEEIQPILISSNPHSERHFSITLPLVVTLGVPVNPNTAVADAPNVVELAAAVSVA